MSIPSAGFFRKLLEASSVQDHVVFVSNFGDYLRTIAPGNK